MKCFLGNFLVLRLLLFFTILFFNNHTDGLYIRDDFEKDEIPRYSRLDIIIVKLSINVINYNCVD